MTAAVLPPVSEALSLLDISFVNNEWHGSPATIRRSIQILVDHISVQNVQLSRVEDILAAFGNPSQQGGTVWSKLATKADLSRLEKLEGQVDGLLNECAQLRTHQSAASHEREDLSARMELLKDQMAGLEVRLGLPYAPDSSTTGLDQYGGGRRSGGPGSTYSSPNKRAVAAAGGLAPSVPTGSVLDRVSRLERRADALAEMGTKAEDEVSGLVARMRELEPKLEAQIGHLRGDIKQALALAAASTRMEADAESTSRVKESEKRLLARIQSVESALEGKVSAISAQMGITVSSELDKRVNGLYDHIDMQVQRLCGDLDRLSRDKIDLTALEHYSQRISSLFEGVAQGLADEVSTLVGQLRAEVSDVSRNMDEAHFANQALHDGIRAEMDGMRQLSAQVKEAVATTQGSLSTTPRLLEETRAMVQQAMVDAEQLQKAVTGLNTAMASTSNALELQSHKMGQFSHKLSGLAADMSGIKDVLYGGTAAQAAMGGSVSSSASATPASLLSKLAVLDRMVAEMSAALGSKADDAFARELERRLANMARQQDVTAEGLRSLSATAFKRSDEHASAIQRLTLAVTGNLEERPTTTAVKHMIEGAALEVRERCDSALAPLWDAVRILQSGLRDAAGELKAITSNMEGLQQSQTDSRSKVATDRSSIMAALRKALDEEITSLRAQLEERMDGMDSGIRKSSEQLDLHSQLQDRLMRLASAVEEQLATQVAAWRAGNQQLRTELCGRVDTATASLVARLEALATTCKRITDDLQAVSDAAVAKPDEAAVREIAGTVSRAIAKQEVGRYAEKDDAKWQVWMEEHARRQEEMVTHSELAEAVQTAARQVKEDLGASATSRVDEVRRAVTSVKGELDGRIRAATSRVEVLELRVQDLEAVHSTCATKKEVEELATASMVQRADRAAVDAEVRQLAGAMEEQASALSVLQAETVTRSELAAELARKVDLATYLAQGSARAAAASAGALLGVSRSPPSPRHRERRTDGGVRLAVATGSGAAAAARAVERLQLGESL